MRKERCVACLWIPVLVWLLLNTLPPPPPLMACRHAPWFKMLLCIQILLTDFNTWVWYCDMFNEPWGHVEQTLTFSDWMNGTDETDQDFKFCSGVNVGLEKRGTGVNNQFNVLSLVLYLIVFEVQPGYCIIVVYCSWWQNYCQGTNSKCCRWKQRSLVWVTWKIKFFFQTKCSWVALADGSSLHCLWVQVVPLRRLH